MPHQRPIAPPEYLDIVTRIHEVIENSIPPGSVVLIVSKGDERLVDLPSWRGWHFPQDRNGSYPGYHPADSDTAIKHLEDLRDRGADYLVIPSTSFWWLEHYPELAQHLASRYPVIIRLDDTCLVYALREVGVDRLGTFVDSLLPDDAVVAVVSMGDDALLDIKRTAWHFPSDPIGAWAPDRFATGAEAALALELARNAGARFLVVPAEAASWLERYPDFLAQVGARFHRVAVRRHLCSVFDLQRPDAHHEADELPVEDDEAQGNREPDAEKGRGLSGVAAKLIRALPWERRAARRRRP
jgi:hypothetical protein